MRYVVTGGCGFIGSNLSKRLMNEGNEVIIIDDLSTGSMDNVKDFYSGDVLKKIKDINKLKKIDGIFHLGIPSSSPMYRENRDLIGKTTTEFIDIMEFSKNNDVKVVFASSSSVYNGNKPPFNEDMQIVPLDFYTELRLFFERISRVYNDFYNVNAIAMRPFSIYGLNEHSKGRFANLVTQILWAHDKKMEFDIYNNGNAIRDFVHVDDAVTAFRLAMKNDSNFNIFNIGTGKGYSINQVIEKIGFEGAVFSKNPIKNYVDATVADTNRSRKELGFESKIDLMSFLESAI